MSSQHNQSLQNKPDSFSREQYQEKADNTTERSFNLSKLRHQKWSQCSTPKTKPVKLELTGTQSSADGSDTSDCSAGAGRPVRSITRKAVKRKRSLSHLSVVTRFYMRTDQPEDDCIQNGMTRKTVSDYISVSADLTQSLPAGQPPSAALTKHSKCDSKPHAVKAKQATAGRPERKVSLKAQNTKSTTENCCDSGSPYSQEASSEVAEDSQESAGDVPQPVSCPQLSAVPAVYLDLLEMQQCLPGGPLFPPASSLAPYQAPATFPGSALNFTRGNIPPVAADSVDRKYKKICCRHIGTSKGYLFYRKQFL
ncbi:hypothetical protein ACOMHN_027332 [Nucella lapillus]